MYRIFSCITDLHHPGFVIMAALLCVVGAGITLRLYRRAQDTRGVQRVGWCVLAAGTAGSTIWSTHFIAMLGYRPNVPIELDPGLTSLSLLVAMLGASAGLMLALLPRWRQPLAERCAAWAFRRCIISACWPTAYRDW